LRILVLSIFSLWIGLEVQFSFEFSLCVFHLIWIHLCKACMVNLWIANEFVDWIFITCGDIQVIEYVLVGQFLGLPLSGICWVLITWGWSRGVELCFSDVPRWHSWFGIGNSEPDFREYSKLELRFHHLELLRFGITDRVWIMVNLSIWGLTEVQFSRVITEIS
jgi:hypothetical protein